jgi:hypothetical protein
MEIKNKKYNELLDRFVLEVMVDDYIEYLEYNLGVGASAITQFKQNAQGKPSVWVRIPKWNRPSDARVAKFKNALFDQFCFVYAYIARYNDGAMPVIRMVDTKHEPIDNPLRPREIIINSY